MPFVYCYYLKKKRRKKTCGCTFHFPRNRSIDRTKVTFYDLSLFAWCFSDCVRSVFVGRGQRRALRARRTGRAGRRAPPGHRDTLVHRRPVAPVAGGPRGGARRSRPPGGRRPPGRGLRPSGVGRPPAGSRTLRGRTLLTAVAGRPRRRFKHQFVYLRFLSILDDRVRFRYVFRRFGRSRINYDFSL